MSVATYPLQCQCGNVKGVLAAPQSANRAICYCKDCQAFAHALGQADRVLDSRGGSDIVQVLPRNITFTQGRAAITCLRLKPKGLLRWHTSCCNTPIGNTLATRSFSFIGLVHACLKSTEVSLDEAFGPATIRVYTASAKPGGPQLQDVGKGKAAGWFIRNTLRARLNGDYKLTPFFDLEAGAPIATPRVLSREEHAKVMAAVNR